MHIKRSCRFPPHVSSCLSVLLSHPLVVILKALPASELIHHYHLVLTHLWCDVQKLVFLVLLGKVDDVGPPLLILILEVLEEIVEAFITLTHAADTLVQTLSFLTFV
jgi:hypothetical protein